MPPEFNTTEAMIRWAFAQNPLLRPHVHEMDEFTHVWVVGPHAGQWLVFEAN